MPPGTWRGGTEVHGTKTSLNVLSQMKRKLPGAFLIHLFIQPTLPEKASGVDTGESHDAEQGHQVPSFKELTV